MTQNTIKKSRTAHLPIILVVIMLGIEVFDFITPGFSLDRFGVLGWSVPGLMGIFTHSFLHVGFGHWFANAIPFVAMGYLLREHFTKVTIWGTIISGLLIWFIPLQPGIHLGASSLVFTFFGFLAYRGVVTRRWADMVITLITLVVYGGLFFSLLRLTPGISWEGHAFGFLTGLGLAKLLPEETA